eukprot:12645651-Prorocentrum_lima.AAC.1
MSISSPQPARDESPGKLPQDMAQARASALQRGCPRVSCLWGAGHGTLWVLSLREEPWLHALS